MPQLEAPTNFDDESSPENSLAAELGAVNATIPVAVQLRINSPAPTYQAPANGVVGANTFQAIRLPTIRLRNVRTLGDAPVHEIAPGLQRGDIFAEMEAEVNEADSWSRVGLAPPSVVNLLPVNLPPQVVEPHLDELLRRVTQRSDLHNVESVRLRVISAITVSLSRLAMFLPRLQHLDLSGSVLCSLRDLGCGLLHLAHLNVSNCGLNSFDGTSGMPSVRELIADGNMIQRVGPLSQLPLLEILCVRHNRISDLSLLTFLAMCPNLVEVALQGNPVCHLPLYRHTLRSVRTLRVIDGVSVELESSTLDENQRVTLLNNRRNAMLCHEVSATSNASSSHSSSSLSTSNSDASGNEGLSSLSSESPSQLEVMSSISPLEAISCLGRPATAPLANSTATQDDISSNSSTNRPVSASPSTQLQPVLLPGVVTSSIVAGSLLDLIRQQRRRRYCRTRNAWIPESNENSSSGSSSITSNQA